MVKEEIVKRGRGRPRKAPPKPVCTAPVIELISSSDEDEPPPRPAVRKLHQTSSKPPILAKRSALSTQSKLAVNSPNTRVIIDKNKSKNLSDTETLLSILESDDVDSLSMLKEKKKTKESNYEKPDTVKDNLLDSLEDELRYLVEEEAPKAPLLKDGNRSFKKISDSKRDSDTFHDSTNTKRKSEESVIDEPRKKASDAIDSLLQRSDSNSDVINRVKSEKKVSFGPVSERNRTQMINDDIIQRDVYVFNDNDSKMDETKINQLKLPPEVLDAIKKRTNLGRIEKIIEKTDSNKKSKYIVIFNNKGGSSPKKKGPAESKMNALLKGVPAKPSPSKKLKVEEDKELIAKENSKALSGSQSQDKLSPAPKDSFVPSPGKTPSPPREEPVRFTESPLSHEPPLPWDQDGFEKYFKVIERLVEHHDSLDSDSDYEEPEMFSHFKNLETENGRAERANDQINVNNIADTVSREFPGWNAQPLTGSDTICLVRLGLDHRGVMSVKKQIKIDSEYNVSVFANNSNIPEYEGMYDSFDSIKQLVHEIDQL